MNHEWEIEIRDPEFDDPDQLGINVATVIEDNVVVFNRLCVPDDVIQVPILNVSIEDALVFAERLVFLLKGSLAARKRQTQPSASIPTTDADQVA